MDMVLRFVLGGFVVSLFAVLGDVLKPKSFAGLFGAAPSVAMATLTLTILENGKRYAALEARSMIAGACAFLIYAYCCMWAMAKLGIGARAATTAGIAVWLAFAVSSWFVFLR